MNADSIKIESDEDGFRLIVVTGKGRFDRFDFNIQEVAGELLAEVKREIEPWWREGQAVLASMHCPECHVTGGHKGTCSKSQMRGEDAYALYDPKHPDFHDNFSALHDNREEK